jgi:uncharacterized cupin superfamily protein
MQGDLAMLPPVVVSKTDVQLQLSPIEPSWIVEGRPSASSAELSVSEDGRATTVVWECTAGRFNWIYDYDETAHILVGSAIVHNHAMKPTQLGPGDVVLFRRGSRVTWHVEDYVRKLAFVRNPDSSVASKIIGRIRRTFVPKPDHTAGLADEEERLGAVRRL